MGLFDSLFGSSPDVDKSQMSLWNKGQQQLFEDFLLPLLQNPDFVTGPTQGPFGGSLAALEQWAQNVYGGGVTEGGQQAQTALLDILNRGPSDIDNYFTQTVEKPLLESFREDVLPGISRKFAPSGFYSSQRIESEDRAREDLLDALTRSRADVAFQARENDLGRILQSGSTLLSNELGTRGQLMDLFNQGFNRQATQAQLMLSALGLRPHENIATVTPGSPGLLQSFLGPAAQGLGLGIGTEIGPDILKGIFG